MKRLFPLLLLFLLAALLFLAVLSSRTTCRQCGRPIYLFFLRFCSCK